MGLKTFQNVLNLRLCVAQISLPFPLQEIQVYFASCGFAVHITLWEDHVYRKSNFVWQALDGKKKIWNESWLPVFWKTGPKTHERLNEHFSNRWNKTGCKFLRKSSFSKLQTMQKQIIHPSPVGFLQQEVGMRLTYPIHRLSMSVSCPLPAARIQLATDKWFVCFWFCIVRSFENGFPQKFVSCLVLSD